MKWSGEGTVTGQTYLLKGKGLSRKEEKEIGHQRKSLNRILRS
jgi:hypothetical protein